MTARCLFCGGDASEPEHLLRCDGRQGRVDADPVLDPVRAHAVTEVGVARSGDHAADDWVDEMRDGIQRVARRQARLTSDDLWVEVGPDAIGRGNPSALGSVFRSVARDGVIELTSDLRESQRPAHHRKPLRVWRSLVFDAEKVTA